MATGQVTGPVWQYIGFPGQQAAYFLGTSERCPRIRIQRGFLPMKNDIGGDLLPFDRIYQGEEAQIYTELNRWNESVYYLIASQPREGRSAFALPRGSQSRLDVGLMVMGNGFNMNLYLVFPFAGTINQVDPAMPSLYRFPCAIPELDDMPDLGTRPRKLMIAFTAQRLYYPIASNTGLVAGSFLLYDHQAVHVLPPPD